MSKPYLVGWYDAFKWLFQKRLYKMRFEIWKQLVKEKYFWHTKEELVKSNEDCWKQIQETSKNYTYTGDYNYYEDDDDEE